MTAYLINEGLRMAIKTFRRTESFLVVYQVPRSETQRELPDNLGGWRLATFQRQRHPLPLPENHAKSKEYSLETESPPPAPANGGCVGVSASRPRADPFVAILFCNTRPSLGISVLSFRAVSASALHAPADRPYPLRLSG